MPLNHHARPSRPGGAAASLLPARPAGRRLPGRRQDRAAQRRYLAAGSPAGDRPGGPDPDPAGGRDRRHRPLQERQRHVRAPGRGHRAGRPGQRPDRAAARGDLTGRFGGEEFCILLPGTDAAEARQITERLREKISRSATPVTSGSSSRVTISIGVAALGSSRRDLDELLAAADHALYQAKKAGRNQVCVLAGSPG